ncbi:MAG: aldo/keto reductase, partial [Candidatus Rokuibacteriota bacterium]
AILTKLWWRYDGPADHTDQPERRRMARVAVERFRHELTTDYLDIVLLHCLVRPGWDEHMQPYMDVLSDEKQKGRIRALGCSRRSRHPGGGRVRAREALRSLCSLGPLVGLVARPEGRPNGVTALVRVKGEAEWLEPSVLSVRDFADEVLVLDNGAGPETRKTLARLADALGEHLRLHACPELDLFAMSNLGLERARYRWIARWDADFVGHTSGPGDLRRLREYLLALDRRRFYLVHVPAAELAGDLRHQFPDRRLRWDGQVHVASSRARYARVECALAPASLSVPDRILRQGPRLRVALESLAVPKHYRVLRWPVVAYFHVDVKPARAAVLRHFWLSWLAEAAGAAVPTLMAYAERQVREGWGIADLDDAAQHYMAQYCRGLVAFDAAVCGPYPELLGPCLDEARYEVVYAAGLPAGRREAS